ncbi:MAG TPA: acetylornithine deacetylase [Myxococcota bacterium]|nr:acetylornithine deacetylase [Myxococcota bacterium]
MDRYLHDVAERLIACDTVSHRTNEPIVGLLADELDRLGFAVALQAHDERGVRKVNLVARLGPPEPDGLILSGHLDVVPFEGQPGWTRDPLALVADGDRLYGRGTCDMKGFVAQCLAAARRLDRASLERPLVFVFTCDEEIGCLGAERLAPALAALLGELPMPGLCWIGEPTDWRVAYAHKGIVQLDVVAHGRGGHSSLPEAGVNAIALAARAVAAIGEVQASERARPDERWRATFPDAPYTTFNFGTIAGGTASNVIAETCRLRVSYRPLPGGDPLAAHAQVAARLAALEPRDWGSPDQRGAIELLPPRVVPGLCSPRGTELEKTLRAVLGDHEPGGAPFCTDGGRLAAVGIASLICGPGELAQAHQPDESLPRAAFERGPDVILDVLARLLGARRSD